MEVTLNIYEVERRGILCDPSCGEYLKIFINGHSGPRDLHGTFGRVAGRGVAATQYHLGLDRFELLADSLVPLFGDPAQCRKLWRDRGK